MRADFIIDDKFKAHLMEINRSSFPRFRGVHEVHPRNLYKESIGHAVMMTGLLEVHILDFCSLFIHFSV